MKKLSLLMALAMLITVGGVYATWIYHEGPVGSIHEHFGEIHFDEEIDLHSARGILKVDDSGLVIEIDHDGDYVPRMYMTGSLYVYFKPSVNAPDLADGVIELEFALSASQVQQKITGVADAVTYQYGETENDKINVFSKYDETYHAVDDDDAPTLVEEAGTYQGWYRYEITADQLAEFMVLNTDAFLKNKELAFTTYTMYEKYKTAVNSFTYGITVREAQAAA
jgi:hypothetical protein